MSLAQRLAKLESELARVKARMETTQPQPKKPGDSRSIESVLQKLRRKDKFSHA